MARSHPPTLLTLVERTLREECGIGASIGLLIAVSGGPDSMALLHALALLRGRLGYRLHACGVDHGLRSEAPGELALAAQLASHLEVPFEICRVTVARGGNLQARARDARYSALRAHQQQLGCGALVTAHHADDRAETVLLRLLRGAPVQGLSVLPARAGDLLRPMIRATRKDVCLHLQRHGLPSATDPSNADPRFLRARVRGELLPLLCDLSPRIVEHLNALADELGAETLPVIEGLEPSARLKRSQKEQLRRAIRHRRWGSRVLLSEGRVLTVECREGQPSIRLQPKHDPSCSRD